MDLKEYVTHSQNPSAKRQLASPIHVHLSQTHSLQPGILLADCHLPSRPAASVSEPLLDSQS
uniref:Uncharacterized protein n=1 Tax=Kalanchoe fedtschenkoi TaxID=63787 RepID=A0A7N0RGR6_KALFE